MISVHYNINYHRNWIHNACIRYDYNTAVPIWNAEEGTPFLGQGTAPSISF
jgi:hypothetical protein